MYCTTEQLISWFTEQELIQRTDREPFTGAINQTVLDEAISVATRRIDGYLRTVYTLPLESEVVANSDLPKICGDITRYELYASIALDDNSVVQKRYDNAMRWLRDVQAKRVSLGEQDNSVSETGSVVVMSSSSRIDWGSF